MSNGRREEEERNMRMEETDDPEDDLGSADEPEQGHRPERQHDVLLVQGQLVT